MKIKIKEQSEGSLNGRDLLSLSLLLLHPRRCSNSYFVINGVNFVRNKKGSFYSPLLQSSGRNKRLELAAVEAGCNVKLWRIRQEQGKRRGKRSTYLSIYLTIYPPILLRMITQLSYPCTSTADHWPEVSLVVCDSVRRAVRCWRLQNDYFHSLRSVATGTGHHTLPDPRNAHVNIGENDLTGRDTQVSGLLEKNFISDLELNVSLNATFAVFHPFLKTDWRVGWKFLSHSYICDQCHGHYL